MTEAEFANRLATVRALKFREEFETTVYDLYVACTPSQCEVLRSLRAAGKLKSPPTWKNPTDYDRSDLSRRQKMQHALIALSLTESSTDYRDDLCAIADSYHNLKLMGFDVDRFLQQLAAQSGPRVRALLLGWLARTPEDRSPEAFGLRIVESPDGPIAERYL